MLKHIVNYVNLFRNVTFGKPFEHVDAQQGDFTRSWDSDGNVADSGKKWAR